MPPLLPPPLMLIHPLPWQSRSRALMGSVDPIPALADQLISGGRLNVSAALAALLGQGEQRASPPPMPPLPPLTAEPLSLQLDGYRVAAASSPPEGANLPSWQDCMDACVARSWCFAFSFADTAHYMVPAYALAGSGAAVKCVGGGPGARLVAGAASPRTPPQNRRPAAAAAPAPADATLRRAPAPRLPSPAARCGMGRPRSTTLAATGTAAAQVRFTRMDEAMHAHYQASRLPEARAA